MMKHYLLLALGAVFSPLFFAALYYWLLPHTAAFGVATTASCFVAMVLCVLHYQAP